MKLPVISKRDTDMRVTSGLTNVESWWLKEDEEAMEVLGCFGYVLFFHVGRCIGVRANARSSFHFSPALGEFRAAGGSGISKSSLNWLNYSHM